MSRMYFFRALFMLVLCLSTTNAFACTLGFSFQFEALPDGDPYSPMQGISIEAFLNEKYGEGGWRDSGALFKLSMPEIPENSSLIPISVGSENVELAGAYEFIHIYVLKTIKVLDNSRFDADLQPPIFYADGTMSKENALGFGEITHEEGRIQQVAGFVLADTALPYVSARLNLSRATRGRVFVAFVPRDKSEPVKVVGQERLVLVGNWCVTRYHVRGRWPEGLREVYRYE